MEKVREAKLEGRLSFGWKRWSCMKHATTLTPGLKPNARDKQSCQIAKLIE